MKTIFARIKWLYAVIIIFTGMTIMIVTFYLLPKPYAVKLSSWFIRLFIFSPIKVKGECDEGTQMFLINHQSDIDIGVMETITSHDLAWVAKQELFHVPFFGLVLRLPNDIAVERESKTALIKMMKDCKDRLDENRVITIFPEGTRSESGTMKPFKAGAKMVADKYALRVQPIVFIATASYFSNKQMNFSPGTVTAIFLESFVADKSDPDWLTNTQLKMQKVYDDEFANHPRNR
ncbi:MAG: lysophospholipid acyltransferase family protein [Sulfuricurvum sp.]|uniref:lysophospholipid acyltransferase family protein n=1 Tax=Sulfuricurvum sp. TaxID=2025608 RepID=UPI002614F0FD|nr:lysophospholipid acyltransferase family protein [Sulfuricurvum sp.]MDD2829350.1 lysophospholipid acyltransferase family protein [Sulfuricurvum sp.]MDD4949158.1 lysophospholipid acyltransferase family protein [Sulfuricurvum sp.]